MSGRKPSAKPAVKTSRKAPVKAPGSAKAAITSGLTENESSGPKQLTELDQRNPDKQAPSMPLPASRRTVHEHTGQIQHQAGAGGRLSEELHNASRLAAAISTGLPTLGASSQIRLQAEAISQLDEGVVIMDGPDWDNSQIIFVNTAVTHITGYAAVGSPGTELEFAL